MNLLDRPENTAPNICIEENVRVLPKCNHGFHLECIDKWLVSHSSCPMCRHSMNLQGGNKKSGGAAIVQATE